MPHQQRLFESEPEPWELDAQASQLVATVVFPAGAKQPFDYAVPDRLRETLEPGCRVEVPFGRGNRPQVGYCIELAERPAAGRKLKSVTGQIDARSLLRLAMLRLTRWIADRYLCDWGQVLEAVLPAGVRGQAGTRLTTLLEAPPEALAKAREMKLPTKQAVVLKVLTESEEPLTPNELARLARCTQAPITALRRKGLITARTGRVKQNRSEAAATPVEPSTVVPNPAQQAALDAILAALHAREHQTILVHGVTGSGKTEVYIRAIEEVVGFKRQAIVLVPEISLTPQTVERFRTRFGRVAVLHSHLTDAERQWHWQQIADGEVPVVVGARSAVFAPAPHLGLIVLDEEQEGSFKQDSVPRYHARDVALKRARMENIPLVLGSATPSLESWQRAQQGRYRLVELPRRVLDRPLPEVGVIDLRARLSQRGERGAVSRQLHQAMRMALDDGGQIILLLNRRGFSTHIQCQACGHVVRCPECDIALTHHRTQEIALCHYCDYEIPAPAVCPECSFTGIRYGGLGTQRLEAEVRARFPGVPCLRMDTDTMQGRGAHDRAFAAFRAGEVKVLLGTQMIAKGLDFPNVTLVGVINSDVALHLPDFRAAERTFQLVTQVAGRTGRGPKGGRVLVQTFSPDHPAIRAAARHDYAAFAQAEIPMREMLHYPPFGRMIRLVIRGPREQEALDFATQMGQRLQGKLAESASAARVLGPAPAPFARLRGKYRFQIQLQGPAADPLRDAVRDCQQHLAAPDGVQWIADVDPLDML
ncbi:MAG: primosomal protein N' [Thermoguttaceae bacterium]|jgi:primosomal protein N' (replication factor Y)|nr:primosomal protein N' [Thermoguttaceae bacterium]